MAKLATHISSTLEKQLFRLLFLFSLCLPISAFAQNDLKPEQIKKELKNLTKDIKSKENKYKSQNQQIRKFDKRIANYLNELKTLKKKQKSLKAEIKALDAEKKKFLNDFNKAQQVNAEFARLYFMAADNNYFKILLKQGKPEQAARNPVYFSYLQQAYSKSLLTLQKKTQAVRQHQAKLQNRLSNLDDILTKTNKNADNLKIKRDQRKKFLSELDKEIGKAKTRQSRLLKDQERLEKLAKKINSIGRNAKKPPSGMGFAKRKDGLAWPVEGKIIGHYGRSRFVGGLKWRGLLIAANNGTNVRAVASGKVVFADWMTGYGYVLIVDHGKNYLSLYGHNQRLFKSVGESVKPKERIAEVGNSGRSGKPALYFEIRHKGKPVNPKKWLLARKGSR